MNEQVLARFHRYLVDALQRTRPDPFGRPVTVSEIYQDLVPYREARAALGVDLNADYEQALMGLLAGVGERARLEPETVRDQLRRELESPNPNVAIYRGFAACDVWISPLPPSEHQAGSEAAVPAPDPDERPTVDRRWELAEQDDAPTHSESPAAPDRPQALSPDAAAAVAYSVQPRQRCAFCNEPLPVGRDVHFCPSCGADQQLRPCNNCGEAVEPEWRFCINCGAPASA